MTGLSATTTPPFARPMPGQERVQESDTPAALRVAYLVNQYPKGSHTFIRREIAALEERGVQIERISLRRCAEDLAEPADRVEAACTRVILDAPLRVLRDVAVTALHAPRRFVRALRLAWRLGRRSDRGRLRQLFYFAEACACRRWLRARKVQHVHAHFGTNSTMVALLCHELGGPPYSFTVHGQEEFDKPESLALAEKVARSAFAIAISNYGRGQLCRWLPPDNWSRVHVVRCGIDAAFAEVPITPPPATRRLLFVGRLAVEKGLPVLCDAAARLREQGVDFELVLAGDGPDRALVEQDLARRGLTDVVRLLGWCDGARVADELRASRALVLPSFSEGLPVVLMEALALGRPAVTTWVAGIPELVQPGESGWLVPPGDAEALADAMRAALVAPVEELERLGITGMRRARSQHDIRTAAAALHRLLAAAVEGRAPLGGGGS